jgi:hypothetical protein
MERGGEEGKKPFTSYVLFSTLGMGTEQLTEKDNYLCPHGAYVPVQSTFQNPHNSPTL